MASNSTAKATKVLHPCSPSIPTALGSSHAHATDYHSFLISPFHPAPPATPGKRKQPLKITVAPPRVNSVKVERLHRKLLAWFDEGNREAMPWRKDFKVNMTEKERGQRGYEVWVSEIMLQQTQVKTVIDYWNRWMKQFPDVYTLAKADIEEVNSVWSGLGYYSRASRLLSGAKKVVKEYGGILPISASELEKIDGIGPYSAGAISSIAFGQRAPLVDGNVSRVFSRLTALHAPPAAKSTTNLIWGLADLLVPTQRPGDWNAALMDLGATICTPKKEPNCKMCPLSDYCLAFAEVKAVKSGTVAAAVTDIEDCTTCSPFDISKNHSVSQYPMAKERKKAREEETAVCVIEWVPTGSKKGSKSQLLLFKRPEKGLLAGLFEFPSIDLSSDDPTTPTNRRQILSKLLSSLFVDKIPTLKESSTTPKRSSEPESIEIIKNKDLGSILQVYSHQRRIYHILHIVITSPNLPRLASSSKTAASTSTQSIAGRGKFIERDAVNGANLSGAGFKVWDVIKSGVRGDASEKKATAAAKKGKKKVESEVDSESEVEEESEPERRSRTLKRVEINIVDAIDVEEKEEIAFVPILKKRRIQPQSDEEE